MYREFKPIAPLRPYIQCIWTMNAKGEDFTEPQRLVPDGNIEVMLNYGNSSSQSWNDGSKTINSYKGSCVVGQRPGYYFTSATGYVELIGISFKPGGLSPFIDHPVADLTGSIIPLKLFNNALFLEIEERIDNIGLSHTLLRCRKKKEI